MAWEIRCLDGNCTSPGWAANIVDLIQQRRDEAGWLLCRCGGKGYVKKAFDLQEKGEQWEPFVRGIVVLGDPGETYQPFVFLVSHGEPTAAPKAVWFSYYKDLRPEGRLKLGHGPGGAPVLDAIDVVALCRRLIDLGCITRDEVEHQLLPRQ